MTDRLVLDCRAQLLAALLVTAAGAISTTDAFGATVFGHHCGSSSAAGPLANSEPMGPGAILIDPGPVILNRPWRNLVPPDVGGTPGPTWSG